MGFSLGLCRGWGWGQGLGLGMGLGLPITSFSAVTEAGCKVPLVPTAMTTGGRPFSKVASEVASEVASAAVVTPVAAAVAVVTAAPVA